MYKLYILIMQLTKILVAITFGSSQRDSMKKICKSTFVLVVFIPVIVIESSLEENITDLEVIYRTKLQDHISSLSSCVCSIKNLWLDTAMRICSSQHS